MVGNLSGKVALVTGAGSGIGRAAAMTFAQAGARVMIADRDREGGEETVRQIAAVSGDGQAAFVQVDVTDESQVEAMVAGTVSAFGRLDYAHNNAGVGGGRARTAEEVAQAVVWLCSDVASFVTGQAITVDGGWTAQ